MSLEDPLKQLRLLWQMEHRAERQRFTEQRQQSTLAQRVEAGIALDSLTVVDVSVAPGDRLTLWMQSTKRPHSDDLQLRVGGPVILWFNRPDDADAVRGIISKVTKDKIAVMVDGDLAEAFDRDGFHLDQDAPQHTFERGQKAITRALQAKPSSPFADILHLCFGERALQEPQRARLNPWRDQHLNDAQQDAIAKALGASRLAWIHGPPGTGKTRTLIELAYQISTNRETILATAASNMAVDNLAERLAKAGLDVVRLGHPARVHDAAESLTLDAKLAQTDLYPLAQSWMAQANDLRRTIRTKRQRDSISRGDERQLRREANQLMREARGHIRTLQQGIIERAQVICATASGAEGALLKDRTFDWVIIDEATQVMDPIFLIPASRGERIVLAGDPHQLPPTVIDPQAARQGLDTTAFERLLKQHPDAGVMLNVQHRMHASIMHFPSISKYDGQLVAAPSVEGHTLADLDVMDDPLRDAPLIFIDTAGKGWQDVQDNENPSLFNPEQAARTVAEARRLLGRGLSPNQLAIITPYAAQAKHLRHLLAQERSNGLEISTIDSFQGREQEAVIIDMVRSNDRGEVGFLKDTRRMNVALSRARRLLLIVGDSATLGTNDYYDQCLQVIQEIGLWTSAWSDEAPPFEGDVS